MPLKSGRLTPMEHRFVKVMARHGDAPYAAHKAGYSSPSVAASKLMSHPMIADATREEGRRLLIEKGGTLGVYTLMSIAADDKQPAGARVTASKVLIDASGIAVDDDTGGKDPHEMDGNELHAYARKIEMQLEATKRALADRARPVIEQEESPKPDVFG